MEFLRKYWHVTSFVVGLLSGGASYGAIVLGTEINYSFYHTIISCLPGLLFGLISLFYFLPFLKSKLSLLKSFGWVFFSTLSFLFSYYIFMSSEVFPDGYADMKLAGMGFIGGLIILLAFNLFISKLTIAESLVLVMLTTLIPMFLGAEYLSKDSFFAVFTFFPWQAAVMVVFAHAINRANQIEIPSQTV